MVACQNLLLYSIYWSENEVNSFESFKIELAEQVTLVHRGL